MAVDVIMPKLGLTMETGTIVVWRKHEGEPVAEGEILLEVETDKAVVEVPAPGSGILRGVQVGTDQPVPVGTVIARPGGGWRGGRGARGLQPVAWWTSAMATPGVSAATPAARRVAREHGVDLALVMGTGPEGGVKEGDVVAFVAGQSQARPASPSGEEGRGAAWCGHPGAGGFGPGGRIQRADVLGAAGQAGAVQEEPTPASVAQAPTSKGAPPSFSYVSASRRVELNAIRATTARRMAESFQTVPHFALNVEVDMSEAIRMRERLMDSVVKKTGKRLTFTAILVRCVSQVLSQHPEVNASYVDGAIEQYEEINVGVAMALEAGLMVPVIRRANEKSLVETASALSEMEGRAAKMRFRPEELSGGTFTISNLGMYGISEFTAIVNPPESAILAVGQTEDRPVVRDGAVVVRPIMKLTLSIDHRALDGAAAAKFLRDIKLTLENPYLLV